MTVIALIFYNGGVLVVADSRTTMIRTYSPDGVNVKVDIRYDDTAKKIELSKDKDLAVAMAGDAEVDTTAAKAIVTECEDILKKQDATSNKKAEDRINNSVENLVDYGQAGLLIAFRDEDGNVRTLSADIVPPSSWGSQSGSTKIKEVKKSTARGTDNTVPVYLDNLLSKNCPDSNQRSLADAMAIAFMLESKYMKYQVDIYGKKAIVVGGPIKMHSVDDDKKNDINATVDKAERTRLEGMTYKQLRDYFADKIQNQQYNANMLRKDPTAKERITDLSKIKEPWEIKW